MELSEEGEIQWGYYGTYLQSVFIKGYFTKFCFAPLMQDVNLVSLNAALCCYLGICSWYLLNPMNIPALLSIPDPILPYLTRSETLNDNTSQGFRSLPVGASLAQIACLSILKQLLKLKLN
jgi:hypothetical protein